jgi:hypothetical protein
VRALSRVSRQGAGGLVGSAGRGLAAQAPQQVGPDRMEQVLAVEPGPGQAVYDGQRRAGTVDLG